MRVSAYRANFRSLLANVDVSAVGALPYAVAVAREHQFFFHVAEQLAIAFFVLFFDGGNAFKSGSNFVEAFFAGFLSHSGIHVGPLVVFAFGSVEQVFLG